MTKPVIVIHTRVVDVSHTGRCILMLSSKGHSCSLSLVQSLSARPLLSAVLFAASFPLIISLSSFPVSSPPGSPASLPLLSPKLCLCLPLLSSLCLFTNPSSSCPPSLHCSFPVTFSAVYLYITAVPSFFSCPIFFVHLSLSLCPFLSLGRSLLYLLYCLAL
ncbi:hypothetical protein AB205_0015990 [Aquarana catesbeiana]|uniref:Uncharacterized protein n=1 Tax=Aquarana catesbeiana TaxID=8400 RepID=A0A2G9SF50_AQUCT|nr:hypothetical protein AB205_0015990 [Aquarana catesbeiana]